MSKSTFTPEKVRELVDVAVGNYTVHDDEDFMTMESLC